MNPNAYESGASATVPTTPASPSIGYMQPGNADLGVMPTILGHHWFYRLSEEIKNLILAGGLTPSDSSLTQIRDAIMSQNIADSTAFRREFFTPIPPVADQILFGMIATRPFRLPAGLAGSKSFIWDTVTSTQAWSINKIASTAPSTIVEIGQFVFTTGVGGRYGGIVFSSQVDFAVDDILYVRAPAVVDPGLLATATIVGTYL